MGSSWPLLWEGAGALTRGVGTGQAGLHSLRLPRPVGQREEGRTGHAGVMAESSDWQRQAGGSRCLGRETLFARYLWEGVAVVITAIKELEFLKGFLKNILS